MADISLRPDFRVVTSHLRGLTEQADLISNLPAVDGGLRLLQALEALQGQLTDMRAEMRAEMKDIRTEMRTEMKDIRTELTVMKTHIKDTQEEQRDQFKQLNQRNRARDRNYLLALENRCLNESKLPFKPLLNWISGEVIESYPQTVGHFGRLSDDALMSLLRELDLDVGGDTRARRRRLLLATGLRVFPNS